MIKDIIHDKKFLSNPSVDCTPEDKPLAQDLIDTLTAHKDECVGMAANMIGVSKNAIIFLDEDDSYTVMFNPRIISSQDPYTTQEGCLSLPGKRKTTRYRQIEVLFLNKNFREKVRVLTDFQAQIVQHELDHTKGVLI